MELNESITHECRLRHVITTSTKKWKRISFNDFGVKYPQDFIEAKRNEKTLWKNLFLQKSMTNLKEE